MKVRLWLSISSSSSLDIIIISSSKDAAPWMSSVYMAAMNFMTFFAILTKIGSILKATVQFESH